MRLCVTMWYYYSRIGLNAYFKALEWQIALKIKDTQ